MRQLVWGQYVLGLPRRDRDGDDETTIGLLNEQSQRPETPTKLWWPSVPWLVFHAVIIASYMTLIPHVVPLISTRGQQNCHDKLNYYCMMPPMDKEFMSSQSPLTNSLYSTGQ
jgi:hypothetical protein